MARRRARKLPKANGRPVHEVEVAYYDGLRAEDGTVEGRGDPQPATGPGLMARARAIVQGRLRTWVHERDADEAAVRKAVRDKTEADARRFAKDARGRYEAGEVASVGRLARERRPAKEA